MKILIEQYGYPKEVLARLLDPHYYSELQNGSAQIPYVGYFLSHKIPDTVFILPKVFIIEGKAFGKYAPEDIINFENLEEKDKRTVFALSTWIYRAIKLYFQRKSLNANNLEVMQNVVSHHGANSETMIDIILALLKFNKEHQNLFTYITRLKHSGQNKIHWQKTISKSAAIIQNGRPIYLQPHTKQKEVNFDEELIVLFYSVLNYLNAEFHFEVRSIFGYDLYKPYQVKDMIDSGKGTRMLRQNRRKYFTDEMVQLWNLLFTFFAESQHVQSKDNQDEQAMLVRDFNLVFEDMIDSLIGDTSLPKGLKEQKDGKIIDHLYRDRSLIESKDDVYFIGDSKYYKEENELGTNSIYKQFTYAKNVIQWNMDFFHKEGKYDDKLMYRDDKTEGYNITPNFFIRGHIDKEKLNDYTNSGLRQEGDEKISYHFENRLFDRDTLILQSYNINFLFVLAAYVQGPGDHKEHIRSIFRDNIKEVLQRRYQFYALKPRVQQEADQYMEENFSKVLGKVFAPYKETQTNCYSLALDTDEKHLKSNQLLRDELAQYFYVKEVEMRQIDQDPEKLFGESEKTVQVENQKMILSGDSGVLMVMLELKNLPAMTLRGIDKDSLFATTVSDIVNQTPIHLGIKTTSLANMETLSKISNVKYILFHQWNDKYYELYKVDGDINLHTKNESLQSRILESAISSVKYDFYMQVHIGEPVESPLKLSGKRPNKSSDDLAGSAYDVHYMTLAQLLE